MQTIEDNITDDVWDETPKCIGEAYASKVVILAVARVLSQIF